MILLTAREVRRIIHQLAKQVSYVFVLYGESTEEDRDIYTYVCEAVISTSLNILLCLITAFILGNLFEGFLFLSVFALIRRYTGGYHAPTHTQCIVVCNVMVAIAILILRRIEWLQTLAAYSLVSVVAMLGILSFAPVQDKNKTSGREYRQAQKSKSMWITLLVIALGLLGHFGLGGLLSATISVALMFVLLGILCGSYVAKAQGKTA